ncbi:Zinc finger C3HC-like protein [Neofusicoccum parvum]|uniref:Zinc finger C3HC-like protein n=2 Tax=Neofusicoccum parvum TaxID=310453 RepID=A0ACB5S457_9PEZI|nr:putative c3hc zinc finger domain-containing protein [Neofusicoccum parvum UCRNP2]GME27590.1 Zinc finger C3HC-like protein [Neofusicoccum parvum]GME64373.1 Zinc finger C3HC-like protein [Neofusicoccum parvum]
MAALTTSKRKFNRILDNITASSSTTSLASLRAKNASAMSVADVQNEPPPKRTRNSLSGDSLASVENDRPETGASTSSPIPKSASSLSLAQRAKSIRLIKKDKAKEAAEPKKAPNYTPWSHDHFVERMKTFADVKLWSPKPDRISEVEWAKRGWVCENRDTVACKGGCEKRIVVKLEPKKKDTEDEEVDTLGEELDEALVERYVKLIVDGHDEGCLWRKAGCKEDIYHVPIANYEEHIKPGLIERHKSLLNIRYQLPALSHLQYPGTNPDRLEKALPEELTQSLSSENFETTLPADSTDQKDIEKRIQLFALYGWHGEDRGKYSIVYCHECHQRTGLWMYLNQDTKLDLAEAHRIHCPWLNPESQGGRPIWELLQKRLLNRIRETTSSVFTTQSSEPQEFGDIRPPSSAADSEQADKKRMNRLRKAMKSFGGKMKK